MNETEQIPLTGGTWRPVRGVLRWTPNPGGVARGELEELRQRIKGKSRTIGGADLIACPTCHARLSQTCKTVGGNPTTAHADRIGSRRCICGELLAPKKTYCEPCRQRARKETYRLREIRKASADRRVA